MTTFFPEGTLLSSPENQAALSSLSALESAMEHGKLLEAVAQKCEPDLTLRFDLGGIPAFMPKEEVTRTEEDCEIRDIAVITRVGKPCVFLIDRIVTVSDEEAMDMTRLILQTDGLFVGISSGAALAAAVKIAREDDMAGKRIALILPDSGERYLSTGVFNQ